MLVNGLPASPYDSSAESRTSSNRQTPTPQPEDEHGLPSLTPPKQTCLHVSTTFGPEITTVGIIAESGARSDTELV